MKIAIIPARGGSKRIPRKNIRLFGGAPIITYSITAALSSELFDRVIVSTDDSEIAEVSRSAGAEAPFVRPRELSDDFVGTTEVVKHAIEWVRANGASVDSVCCIYATAPFVNPYYLNKGLETLISSGSLYAFSVTSFSFPIQRAIRVSPHGGLQPFYPEYTNSRSQDLEPSFHDAAQFYWGRAHAFVEELPIYAPHSSPVYLPRWTVQDIDTEEDWRRAEMMFEVAKLLERLPQ